MAASATCGCHYIDKNTENWKVVTIASFDMKGKTLTDVFICEKHLEQIKNLVLDIEQQNNWLLSE